MSRCSTTYQARSQREGYADLGPGTVDAHRALHPWEEGGAHRCSPPHPLETAEGAAHRHSLC